MKNTDLIPTKLHNASVPKDKKALYSLVRWAYLHPEATFQEISSRINMTYLSQRGYMKQYNNASKRIYNRSLNGERYNSDPQYRSQVLFHTRKSRVPYSHYAADDLVVQDLKKIDQSIKKLANDMSVHWRAPKHKMEEKKWQTQEKQLR